MPQHSKPCFFKRSMPQHPVETRTQGAADKAPRVWLFLRLASAALNSARSMSKSELVDMCVSRQRMKLKAQAVRVGS
jgi:hypothetical protein